MSRTQPSSPRDSSQLFSQVQDAKYDSTVQESLNFSVLRDQPAARSRRMVTRSMASRYPQFPREMTTPGAKESYHIKSHKLRQQASSIRASRPADFVTTQNTLALAGLDPVANLYHCCMDRGYKSSQRPDI